MEKGEQQDMKAFDYALFDLFRGGRINYEEALKNADSKNNLRLRIQLSEGKEVVEDDLDEDDFPGGLSLMSTDSNDNQMF